MALNLQLEDVTPFLPPLGTPQRARVTAWLPVLDALLDARYGTRIGPAVVAEDAPKSNRVLFVAAAADAIERRLAKPAGLIDSQSIGGASVKYNNRAALSRWFLPEELDQLDEACGIGGGVRTVRMHAPNGARFGNATRAIDQLAESDGHHGGD